MMKRVRKPVQESGTSFKPHQSQFTSCPFAPKAVEPEAPMGEPRVSFSLADIDIFPLETVQPKLRLGPVGDRYEKEVETVFSQGSFGHNAMAAEREQVKPLPNRTGMPDSLKAGIESLSGIDMSDVRVHANSDKPAELNALAYTQGNQIHLGPGQERHLPHEAWHAVQQKQGRVRATMKMRGIEISSEPRLETEADTIGDRAIHGELEVIKGTLFSHDRRPDHSNIWTHMDESTQMISHVAVIQRMTMIEYDMYMKQIQGSKIDYVLESGLESLDLTLTDDKKRDWRNHRAREIIKFLETIDFEKFKSDEGQQTTVQEIIGRIGRGDTILPPPSPKNLIESDGFLFRGTTKDPMTGEPYIGSEGSSTATPTTISAEIAALFATKSETEFRSKGAEGIIIYGPARNVENLGFVEPDVMAGQEQEISVKANPSVTNKALGQQMSLKDFRRALSVAGVAVPEIINPGAIFDSKLLAAARKNLNEEMNKRLMEILTAAEPNKILDNWEALLNDLNLCKTRILFFKNKIDESTLNECNNLAKSIDTEPNYAKASENLRILSICLDNLKVKLDSSKKDQDKDSETDFNLFGDD